MWRTGGITKLSQTKLMTVVMTNLLRVSDLDEVLEDWLEKKNTSKAAEHQWKINFGVWDCVLLHVCLYVDTCLTCDGGLSRGGLLSSLNDALCAGSAPHWPWYPVAIQFRPTSSCIPPPASRTLNPWTYFPWLLAVFGCALMKRPMALLYSFLRQLRDVIDREEFTLWPEFLFR